MNKIGKAGNKPLHGTPPEGPPSSKPAQARTASRPLPSMSNAIALGFGRVDQAICVGHNHDVVLLCQV